MGAHETETPIQRAIREANEQEAAKPVERLDAPPPPPPRLTRGLQLFLDLEYNLAGGLVGAKGFVNGRCCLAVMLAADERNVGELAKETLRLGALGALLGP